VHDADTVRFHLGEDPAEVVAIQTSAGMGAGVEDSVMSVWQMPSGATVMTHESFTHRFAGTGIEFHGTKGSIRATGVMTQRPIGQVTLTTEDGEERSRSPTTTSMSARSVCSPMPSRARAARAPDGIDGIKSLAVASAVAEAATTGRRVAVDYGGV
jgi:1,5-anhydro-D-fructose reductase (1,5-anhydro-D-mannitol-forming)